MKEVPAVVRQLVAEAVDSIAELEAILLLREHRERDWSPEEAGARLYVSVAVAGHLLSVLAKRGFLTGNEGRFRFDPQSRDIDEAVAALAEAYSTNLVGVTHLVHAKPAPGVVQFAKAFRIRKDG